MWSARWRALVEVERGKQDDPWIYRALQISARIEPRTLCPSTASNHSSNTRQILSSSTFTQTPPHRTSLPRPHHTFPPRFQNQRLIDLTRLDVADE